MGFAWILIHDYVVGRVTQKVAQEGKGEACHWDDVSLPKEKVIVIRVMEEYDVVGIQVEKGRVVADGFVGHQVSRYVIVVVPITHLSPDGIRDKGRWTKKGQTIRPALTR